MKPHWFVKLTEKVINTPPPLKYFSSVENFVISDIFYLKGNFKILHPLTAYTGVLVLFRSDYSQNRNPKMLDTGVSRLHGNQLYSMLRIGFYNLELYFSLTPTKIYN